MSGVNFDVIPGPGVVELTIPDFAMLAGSYLASVGILRGNVMTPYDVHLRAYPFSVLSDSRQFGVMHLHHSWEHRADGARAAKPARVRAESALST